MDDLTPILFADDDYPQTLRHIHDPPPLLYLRGKLSREPCFAIVGTRRATPEGKLTAKKFARELARAGFAIVSGLALGIDAAAHEGCLEAGGTTIAVLANGLGGSGSAPIIYPSENERLGLKILERGGALISEYPLGDPSYPGRFLERNRIISGLSQGVLIVECPENSGSRVTGRLALEQNRDVFVVPGPISHPNFAGSHQLIRQGAELVTRPEEILEAYDMIGAKQARNEIVGENHEETQVLRALQSIAAPADVDKIIAMTKLEPHVATRTLSFLVLKNLVKETEAGYIIE